MATSGKGGIGVFIGICIISGVFGIADGHVQGGLVGDLYLMCPEFVQVSLFFLECLVKSWPFLKIESLKPYLLYLLIIAFCFTM